MEQFVCTELGLKQSFEVHLAYLHMHTQARLHILIHTLCTHSDIFDNRLCSGSAPNASNPWAVSSPSHSPTPPRLDKTPATAKGCCRTLWCNFTQSEAKKKNKYTCRAFHAFTFVCNYVAQLLTFMPRSCAVHLHFVSGEQLMMAPVVGYKRFIYAFQLLDKCRFSVAVVVFLHFFFICFVLPFFTQ